MFRKRIEKGNRILKEDVVIIYYFVITMSFLDYSLQNITITPHFTRIKTHH